MAGIATVSSQRRQPNLAEGCAHPAALSTILAAVAATMAMSTTARKCAHWCCHERMIGSMLRHGFRQNMRRGMMRDFFIRSLEAVINVVIVIFAIGILVTAGGVAFGGGQIEGPMGAAGGFGVGLAILVGGGIYLIIFGGFMYLGLGIYQNTKRTADLLERQSRE
jgi:hypothetical protein